MKVTLAHWAIFNAIVLMALGLDLFRSYRSPHPVGVKEALLASAGWIGLALVFNGWIYWTFGPAPALTFFTGYLLEKSLSVDNLFVFLLIFSHFGVPPMARHYVLFCGALGAIVMRGLLIWGGIALTQRFEWIFPLFGAFLMATGARLAFKRETREKIESHWLHQWLKRTLPFSSSYQGRRFFVEEGGRLLATPLLAVLLLVEMSDLLFAFDSVPAILGITQEPFIVYTSNIFAILGLRSLFFALEGIMQKFYLLHYALAFILVFIGSKMILAPLLLIPTGVALLILILALLIGVGGSLLFPNDADGTKTG